MRVLAIDVGSSSVKAAWFEGRVRGEVVHEGYRTRFEGERVEVAAGEMAGAMFRAGRKALAGRAVEAVAFCTFSSGLAIVERDSARARRGIITHQDRRSAGVAEELVKAHGRGFWLKRAGNLPYPGGIAASSLAWVARHESGVLKGARVGQVSSLVGLLLTGRWAIDPSNGVFLGLMHVGTLGWDERLCEAVGVEVGALPEVVFGDEVLGRLTGEAGRRLGVRKGAEVAVVGGLVDTSAAVIQRPMEAGRLTHSAGSTDVLAMCVAGAAGREGILSRPVGVRGERFGGKEGRGGVPWLAVRTIAASGAGVAWVRRVMFSEVGEGVWQRTVRGAVRAVARGEAGVEFVPTLAGDRAAIEQPAGGELTGLTLGTTREEILRGLLAALAEESGRNYAMLRELHRPGREVTVMGGATDLATLMHGEWAGGHVFRRLTADNLAGLVMLARRVV